MKSNDQKYVMRAPPRRRIKGDEPDDQPVFLRKAFSMISTCPPEIGGWSEKGDTVVIRDVKQFSEKVIPTAYKHNNFSSFVRQLNFYGFRKVKSESMDHADWWEFRHPQFLRDSPALLSEIKRSVHFTEGGSGQEVHELRSQVTGLNERIAAMNEKIDQLAGIINTMQLGTPIAAPSSSEAQKKRKLVVKGALTSSTSTSSAVPLQRLTSTDSTFMIDEFEASGAELPSGPELLMMADGSDFFGNKSVERNSSIVPGWDEDEEGTDMLFTETAELLMDDEPVLPQASVIAPAAEAVPATAAPAAAAIGAVSAAANDISTVLDSLSPELRLRFVDRLAEVMGAQLTQNIAQQVQVQVQLAPPQPQQLPSEKQPTVTYTPALHVPVSAPTVPASSSSAAAAYPASSDPAQFRLPSGSKAPEIALPLASAAIAALLSSMQAFAHSPQILATSGSSTMIKKELACK